MPFVPTANVVQAELRFTYDLQKCENVLDFLMDDAPTPEVMLELGDILATWWKETASARVVSGVQLREVYLTDQSSATGPAVTSTEGLPWPGAINLEGAPSNVAACISFRTAARGRSFRGRNYLLGISNEDINTNTLTPTYLDAWVGYYEAMATAALGVGATHVVVSRFSGIEIVDGKRKPIPREAGIATPVITYTFSDSTVDSQRARLPNH